MFLAFLFVFLFLSTTQVPLTLGFQPSSWKFFRPTLRIKEANSDLFAKTPSTSGKELSQHQSSSSAAPSSSTASSTTSSGEIIVNLDEVSKKGEFESFKPSVDLSEMYVKEEIRKSTVRQAGWFPMLLSPPALDGSLAGDVGFDPFGFAGQSKDSLYKMREAEIKHSRLAMLAAIGWPASELWHKQFASILGLPSLLSSEEKAPSVLNGGLLNEWIIGAGVFTLVIGSILEFRTFQMQKKAGYKPGALGFDPLGLYSIRSKFGLDVITEKLTVEQKEERARFEMELAEIKHGRLAMLAITADAMQELVSNLPVIEQTPFFFGDPIV